MLRRSRAAALGFFAGNVSLPSGGGGGLSSSVKFSKNEIIQGCCAPAHFFGGSVESEGIEED